MAEHVARALAPYRGVLSSEELSVFEETLWMMLTTHPVVAPWVERLHREGGVAESGAQARAGASVEEVDVHRSAGGSPGPVTGAAPPGKSGPRVKRGAP